MDYTALRTTLNIRLSDTDNFAFSSAEKDEAMTEAFNDDLVKYEAWDSTLTYDDQTYQYAVPSAVSVIEDIYIRPGNTTDAKPESIASSMWEVVGSNIQFKNNSNSFIPDGYTLYIRGTKKYTTSDTINETELQEYVLNLAILQCLNLIGVKKVVRFLKNDTTMSEIIGMKREIERKVAEYRRRLPKRFENA